MVGLAILVRIIPANTVRIEGLKALAADMGDHPREYGENLMLLNTSASLSGSSPRIRGESVCHLLHGESHGIIPANTGRIDWDFVIVPQSVGSSPRIRGESERRPHQGQRLGIIPANTGRILLISLTAWALRDHPREYGENAGFRSDTIPLKGSSPRIRGE